MEHEIIVVLHLCNDGSREIAELERGQNPNIRIFDYDVEISRAGYETLATDSDSPRSISTYYNWCLAKSSKPWKFKWDADLIATPTLIAYLNGRTWTESPATAIFLSAISHDGYSNTEAFLMCGIHKYGKYIFWEVPSNWNSVEPKRLVVDPSVVTIEHATSLTVLRPYFKDTPWFQVEDTEEARLFKARVDRLTRDFGVEPLGMARANNPLADAIYFAIRDGAPTYVNFYA